jgi:hypothetical protein
MGNGTGNAINSDVRVILDAGELNYISSHLTFTYLRLASFGSPLSAHHPLLFSFFSPVLFVPVPILSHLTPITPMGPARQEVHPAWWRPCSIGGYRWASTALRDGIGVVGG